jgi:hypothetical protein
MKRETNEFLHTLFYAFCTMWMLCKIDNFKLNIGEYSLMREKKIELFFVASAIPSSARSPV